MTHVTHSFNPFLRERKMFPNHNNYYYRPPLGFNFNPYLWDSQSDQGNSSAQFSQAQGSSITQSSIQTVQTASTSTSNVKPRAGPANWGSDQTATLVLSWKDNFKKIESTDNKAAWDAILSKVNECGDKKTAKQCKDKIRNLKQQYKDAKQANKQTGNSPQTSPYYDDFDEVYGDRPIVTFPGIKRSGQQDECSDIDDSPEGSGQTTQQSSGKGKEPASKPSKAKETPSPKKKRRTFNGDFKQQLMELQLKQIEMFEEAETRQENLLLKLDKQQRKAEESARKSDQELLLKITQLIMKK